MTSRYGLFKDDFAQTEEAGGGPVWLRPGRGEGFHDRGNLLLFGHIMPGDVHQGNVGDCWLLSAMSALAEFPAEVMHLISPSTLAPDGKYVVSLYSWAQHRWIQVVVDDRLAVSPLTKQAKFVAISEDNEIWPCILEKAVAKLCGGYPKLTGGNPCFAFGLLTACTDVLWLKKNSRHETWDVFQPRYHTNDPKEYKPERDHKVQTLDSEEVLDLIQDSDNRDFMMCCGKYTTIKRALCDTLCPLLALCRRSSNRQGIAYGHAYSLITVASDVAGSGEDLLCLRNPWGTRKVKEWKGDWSDRSALWDEYPEVADELEHTIARDGLFWMRFEDFVENFDAIFICRKPMRKGRGRSMVRGLSPPSW